MILNIQDLVLKNSIVMIAEKHAVYVFAGVRMVYPLINVAFDKI